MRLDIIKTTSEFILKWTSNIVILLAALTTSLDITPLNKYLFLTGSITWALVGFLWRQPSLWSGNLILAAVYTLGFIF
jgi:hypothetical protein